MCHATSLSQVRVLPGLAHLSPTPFGTRNGAWWGAWRERREFVGRFAIGARRARAHMRKRSPHSGRLPAVVVQSRDPDAMMRRRFQAGDS